MVGNHLFIIFWQFWSIAINIVDTAVFLFVQLNNYFINTRFVSQV